MIMTSRALRRATERVRLLRSEGRPTDGFTLIELLVVISLVMILSSVAMASYNQAVIRAREAALKSDIFHLRDAISQYYADTAKYPDSLQTLVSEGYLRAIPKDQFMDSTHTWVTAQAEPQPGSTTTTTGICDVRSGSDKIALDGSRYADW